MTETKVGYNFGALAGVTSINGQMGAVVVSPSGDVSGPVPTRLISLGDSLSLASSALGASTIANMYMRKIAAYLGLGTTDGNGAGAPNAGNFVEAAISGISSQRYINASNRNLSITANDLVCGIPLFNTMRSLTPDPRFLQELQMQLEATLAWLSIPESLKTRAILRGTTTVNPAVTTVGGTWAYFAATVGTDLNGMDLRSTNGTSATFPAVSGDTVYVWYMRSTLSEAFAITVDGISHSVGGAVSYNTWLDGGIDWELCLLRVTGLTPGTHTVAAVRGSGVVNIVAVAGFTSSAVRATCAAVLLPNCPVMTTNVAAQGYAFAGSQANDPLSNAVAVVAITPGASPYVYTAATDGVVVVSGGTVTLLEVSRDEAAYFTLTGVIAGEVFLTRGDSLRVTYAVAPTMNFLAASPALFFGHAGVDAYNQLLESAVRNLQDDGLRISLLDIKSLTMPTNHVAADTVHLNDTWNERIFRTLRRKLYRGGLGGV